MGAASSTVVAAFGAADGLAAGAGAGAELVSAGTGSNTFSVYLGWYLCKIGGDNWQAVNLPAQTVSKEQRKGGHSQLLGWDKGLLFCCFFSSMPIGGVWQYKHEADNECLRLFF